MKRLMNAPIRAAVCVGIMMGSIGISSSPAFASDSYPLLKYDEHVSTSARCLVEPSRIQASKAVELMNANREDEAFRYAGSAWQYQGKCKGNAGQHRWAADAMFIIAVVLVHRGDKHAGSIDAGISTAEYQECIANPREASYWNYCKAQIQLLDRMSG